MKNSRKRTKKKLFNSVILNNTKSSSHYTGWSEQDKHNNEPIVNNRWVNNFNYAKQEPSLKRKTLDETPTILIGKEFKSKVDFLHSKVGAVEWSGVLVYKIIEGNIETPNKFIVEVVDIILMDIGSAAYTEYSLADAMSKDNYVFDKISDIMMDDNLKVGHIHTHHNMAAYFSGTDLKELDDNTKAYNYYLSLIVNFKDINEWCAKIAFEGNVKESYSKVLTFKNDNGDFTELKTNKNEDEKCIFSYDCKLKKNEESFLVEEGFVNRYNEIEKSSKKSLHSFYTPGVYHGKQNSYLNRQTSLFDNNEIEGWNTNNKKEKVIVNFEFNESFLKDCLANVLEDGMINVSEGVDYNYFTTVNNTLPFITAVNSKLKVLGKNKEDFFNDLVEAVTEGIYDVFITENITIGQANLIKNNANTKLEMISNQNDFTFKKIVIDEKSLRDFGALL